jgi:hypothetical protein
MHLLMVLLDLLPANYLSIFGAGLHQGNHFMPVTLPAIPQAHIPLVVAVDAVTVLYAVQNDDF